MISMKKISKFITYAKFIEIKKTFAREMAFNIGSKLAAGQELPKILKSVVGEAINKKEEKALMQAAENLEKGIDLPTVFRDRNLNILPKHRYVISLPINGRIKGNILRAATANNEISDFSTVSARIAMASIQIIGLVIICMTMFVMPQFVEISYELGVTDGSFVNAINLCRLFVRNPLVFILPLLLGVVLPVTTWLSRTLFSIEQYKEETELISILNEIPFNERWQVIENLSSRVFFPKIYSKLRRAVDLVGGGMNLNDAVCSVKLSDHLTWVLNNALENENCEFLKDGLEMLKQRSRFAVESSIRCFEVFIILVQGAMACFVSYLIFGSIYAILCRTLM